MSDCPLRDDFLTPIISLGHRQVFATAPCVSEHGHEHEHGPDVSGKSLPARLLDPLALAPHISEQVLGEGVFDLDQR